MAAKTSKARAIVLRKTKLGEKDLIITFIDESGSLRRGVAKGARKPGGSYASRLELFTVVDVMFAEGRTLDVVTDAKRAVDAHDTPSGLEQTTCAAPIAELICAVAQEGLTHERLFDMTALSFSTLSKCESAACPAVTAAALLKALSMAGFRPSFDMCVECASPIAYPLGAGRVPLSYADGGVVCASCAKPAEAVLVDGRTIEWARALLFSTFADIAGMNVGLGDSFAVLHLVREWTRVHVGRTLKSLEFMFASAIW